ncbi:MAG TPA: hypothetical protein VH797_02270 [Nitrososphaeraceae archaeon]
MTIWFFDKPPNEVIFVELELVVLHGSSFTQVVLVQLPFSHIVVVLVLSCVFEKEIMGLKDNTNTVHITQISQTAAVLILSIFYIKVGLTR